MLGGQLPCGDMPELGLQMMSLVPAAEWSWPPDGKFWEAQQQQGNHPQQQQKPTGLADYAEQQRDHHLTASQGRRPILELKWFHALGTCLLRHS